VVLQRDRQAQNGAGLVEKSLGSACHDAPILDRIACGYRRGVAVVHPNPVWSADSTDIRLERGFAYLVAMIDWYSRKVLSWRLNNSMEVEFCVDALEEALRVYDRPAVFTEVLKRKGVTISMDGRERALDNLFVERLWRTLKYGDIYLKGDASLSERRLGLTEYFAFYNGEQPHPSLGSRTANKVYRRA
jgi:putative transposase